MLQGMDDPRRGIVGDARPRLESRESEIGIFPEVESALGVEELLAIPADALEEFPSNEEVGREPGELVAVTATRGAAVGEERRALEDVDPAVAFEPGGRGG